MPHLLGGWCHEASPAKCWKSVGLPTRQSSARFPLFAHWPSTSLAGRTPSLAHVKVNFVPRKVQSTKNGGKLICKKNILQHLISSKMVEVSSTNISSGAACYLKWSWPTVTFLMHHELEPSCSLIYAKTASAETQTWLEENNNTTVIV